jgi:hypothetical protein
MINTCPHCGARLSVASDPFCPECREALDEVPAAPSTPEQRRAWQLTKAKILRYSGWFLLIAGLIAARNVGGAPEAAVDLTMIIVGVSLIGLSYWLFSGKDD